MKNYLYVKGKIFMKDIIIYINISGYMYKKSSMVIYIVHTNVYIQIN